MNIKKRCQHQKESEEINRMITQLQAHVRGYLIRKFIKNKIQLCNKQELYAVKIQVSSYLIYAVIFLFLTKNLF